MRKAIGQPKVPVRELKLLSNDPDGCLVEFGPNGRTHWKIGRNVLAIEIRHPQSGGMVKVAFLFPGAASQWKLTKNQTLDVVTLSDESQGLGCRLEVVGLNRIQFNLQLSTPPRDGSVRLSSTSEQGVKLAVDLSGRLTVTKDLDTILGFAPLHGRDASGKVLKASWKVHGSSEVSIDLTEIDWQGVQFPVEVN